jgi:DNA-directed RNA polymerase beta subunit
MIVSSKQLSQTVTHLNCKRPYIIGENWFHLTNSTRLFRLQAKCNGSIIYSNNEIMIVLDDNRELRTISVPEYVHTSYSFATRLRYKRPIGEFKSGEILYEYDNFIDGVPSFGYNVNTAYLPFFGYNFEDCIVISESLSEKLRSQKIEKVIIPIYVHTLFKQMYHDSKYGFIPEINQSISNNVVAISASPRNGSTNPNKTKSTLRSFNIYDFSSIINDTINFNSSPIVSKLINSKVKDIRIHMISNQVLIDRHLQQKVELIKSEYVTKVKEIARDVASVLGPKFAEKIVKNHYILSNPKNELPDIGSLNDLCYIIELDLIKDEGTKIGDKLSNRYAGKGVIGLIIPDELRPYNHITKEPIDIILGPLSVYARSNFSTVLEGLLAKTISYCEHKILEKHNPEFTHSILLKLSNISNILYNHKYAEELLNLSNLIKIDHDVHQSFINSIVTGGLFFEVPNFCNINIYELQQYIKTEFNITSNDAIVINNQLFDFVREKLNLDIETPGESIVYNNIFNSPMYILKLQQLAASKFTVRDFGLYSSASKQPIEDGNRQNRGSHVGSMEFDALIAHNNLNTIREFHTVKSDSIDMKEHLVHQMTTNERYEVPQYKSESYTKLIIDSLMTFLSEN